MKTIWLLSAYRSDSHASWADGLVRHQIEFAWRVFELPGRQFAWRIRSNPLSWMKEFSKALAQQRPDLILASSMVDLATIKGLHPRLANVPCLYYFHENQLAYPIIPGQVQSIEPVMVQLYGALAADRVLFNSHYNRNSFLDGLRALAKRLPDGIPPRLADELATRSEVLPVAVEAIEPGTRSTPDLILWNHRWEHDKQPDQFKDAMIELDRSSRSFELALLGPRIQKTPPSLQALVDHFGERVRINGFIARTDYEHWLGRASIVVSTAIHEFQGLSLLEAVSAGARPVVPDALCYREQYPSSCLYSPEAPGDLLRRLHETLDAPEIAAPDVSDYLSPTVQPEWTELLQSL
ncbi:MAG: DUF3524 domain-containing protein [Pseudomonadota bacterium]